MNWAVRNQIQYAQDALTRLEQLAIQNPDHQGIEISRRYWEDIIANCVVKLVEAGHDVG